MTMIWPDCQSPAIIAFKNLENVPSEGVECPFRIKKINL